MIGLSFASSLAIGCALGIFYITRSINKIEEDINNLKKEIFLIQKSIKKISGKEI